MRTLAVLPSRGFETAKSRLGEGPGALPDGSRRALAEAMFTDVMTALRRARLVDATLVVTGSQSALEIARGHGALVADDPRSAGQSAAAQIGVAQARQLGYERVLLVPGDTPALHPGDVDALLDDARDTPVTIVPDRHGTGTNALVLAPVDAIGFSFGPGSRRLHEQAAAEAGLTYDVVEVATLALDVDTPEDLTALRELLAVSRGDAAHTRGLLAQLDRAAGPRQP